MRFLDFLFPPRVDELLLRTFSKDEFLKGLVPRLIPDTDPGTVALLPFERPAVRAAIHEAKYHGSQYAFECLALALAEYLRDADDIKKPIVVPIPLGRERSRERGYNQVEEVTKRVARQLEEVPIDATFLVRTRETISQVSLPRHKRKENMRGAFAATRPADRTRTYLVIDDVATTGATLQAAIDAVKESGAEHIVPIALAH